ncbi:MAG: ATP-binding protein [Candidatus Magnetominusculus sp. LBB02]|nr:ATP-binding protein [Candidatus Magnetominusculus sp. LBB02]
MAEQIEEVNLIKKIEDLQKRLDEANDILNALRSGVVDAIVVTKKDGTKIYHIEDAAYVYQALVESMNEGAVTLTKEGVILYCNKAFADMMLIDYRNLVGVKLVSLISQEDIKKFESLWQNALVGSGKAELRLQYYGVTLPVSMSCNTHATNREPSYVFAIVSDISETKRAEEALKQSRDELENKVIERTAELQKVNARINKLNQTLEQRVVEETNRRMLQEHMLLQQSKMAAMGEMIAAIAHQWKQPLNALGLIVQNMQDAYQHGELDNAYFDSAVKETMSQVMFMSETVDDFSNFLKPSMEKERFDLIAITSEVLKFLEPQLSKNLISYSINCKTHNKTFRSIAEIIPCDATLITTNKSHLAHIVLNILNNAKEAIIARKLSGLLDAKAAGTIDIDVYKEGETLKLTISDNGGGIAEQLIDKIFDPYFTTKSKDHGTGIGLYISKVIMEDKLGGKIYVRNIQDGAEFTIELPC